MDILYVVVLVVNIASALGVIGLVLMQHGKGADMGAAFGSGASGSLFGATGSANFLSRSTAVLATIFFITALILANLQSSQAKNAGSVMQSNVESTPVTAGAASVPTEGKTADPEGASKAKNVPR
ncbi:MAG: preprotein translocase subunit SecG [Fluviibacter sp.]|jgi:preprotein translocase subunit SecG|nr:preprotein translocase subunit SecG [Rhodocyclales bacterium]